MTLFGVGEVAHGREKGGGCWLGKKAVQSLVTFLRAQLDKTML